MKRTLRKNGTLLGFCALASALLLLLCSQCSPLYPINVWGDANCLLTVGRVMREGGVVYRDIYEQKGPTLYLIHMLAACIADGSFLGVYVMEVISMTAALFMAVRLLARRVDVRLACCGAALALACVLVSGAFSRGDSAEEFCLPYLMTAVYLAMTAYGREDGPMQPMRLMVCGLMAGMVATIKFTVLGLFVGLCAAEGIFALRHGGMKRAVQSAGAFLAGMLLPIAAWCAYFALHGALDEFYTAYVYNNVFLYSGEGRTAMSIVHALWDTLRGSALFVLLAGGGTLLVLLDKRRNAHQRMALMIMALGAFASVYLLGRTWTYSPMALAAFAFVGAEPLLERLETFRLRGRVCAALSALALLAALCLSPNAYLRGVPLDSLAQGRLAQYIHPGASLLQYSHLDDGLYLTSGRLPQEKYFVRLNVELDEMYEALEEAVREGRPDYVLVSWSELPPEYDHYQLIVQDATYDDRDRINKPLFLYRRK